MLFDVETAAAMFRAAPGEQVTKLMSSAATTAIMLAVQRAIEGVQMARLKQNGPPLNYYFPGVEFLIAALGISLGAAAQIANGWSGWTDLAMLKFITVIGTMCLVLWFLMWLLVIEQPNPTPALIVAENSAKNSHSPATAESSKRPYRLSLGILAFVSLIHA